MKKLKKLLSTLIVVVLIAMVLAPSASAWLNIVPGTNGTWRRTTATWQNSNWTQVRAETIVRYQGRDFFSRTPFRPFTATTEWLDSRHSNQITHRGDVAI